LPNYFDIIYLDSNAGLIAYTLSPAKQSQHVNATYCNIFGRNMLRAFGLCVAMLCKVLDIVGSSLKMVKF